jgi:hypothetical protein
VDEPGSDRACGRDANLGRYVSNSVNHYTDPNGLNPNQESAMDFEDFIDWASELLSAVEIKENRCLTPYESMNALNDWMKENDHKYIFIKPGEGEFEGKWLDMRHFLENAMITYRYSSGGFSRSDTETGWALGLIVETGQWFTDIFPGTPEIGTWWAGSAASSFGVEDTFSNRRGAEFGGFLRDKPGPCRSFTSELGSYLHERKAGDLSDSKSYPFLPKSEIHWQYWFFYPERHPEYTGRIMEGARVKDVGWESH